MPGDLQFLRRDKDEPDPLIPGQGLDQRVDGPPVLQVAAHTHGEAGQPPLEGADGEQVGEGLGRVLVPAVPGVDHRHRREHRGHPRGALLVVAHGDDVGIAAHHPDGVGHGFALAHRRGACRGEALHAAAEPQHRRLEGQPGAGARLIEQRGQNLPLAAVAIGGRVADDVVGQVQHPVDLGYAQVGGIDEMTHVFSPFSAYGGKNRKRQPHFHRSCRVRRDAAPAPVAAGVVIFPF